MANDIGGVWRTIGGRRVFIKDGQDLASAMKESGKFKSANKGRAKKEMTEEEKEKAKGDKINETMDKRSEIIDKLDKETAELDNYDRYNLAVSKLENTEGMRPTERQYWAGIKERYEKSQKDDKMYKDKNQKEREEWLKQEEQYNKEAVEEWSRFKDRAQKSLDRSTNPKSKETFKKDVDTAQKEMDKAKEYLSNKEYEKGEKYRNSITETAKNSKEDNVTLDTETGKVATFDKGYSVSFQQSSDNYDDKEYYEKVEECRNKCDGKLYAGKYGGDAEASFHTDDIETAKELMYKYNQESIYDWEHETLIMNDRYDSSSNKTNYEAEKTTNDIMNKAIRSKADKDDLPKHVEIKSQGTSNRKEVSENIQAHILEYYDSPEDFIEQMDAYDWKPTMWHRGEALAEDGFYEIYYDDQRKFLDDLKINPKGKNFSDDRVFQTYKSLIGRESAKLYDRLKKNSYKKYLKAHPLSKMTFAEFKDMKKGDD